MVRVRKWLRKLGSLKVLILVGQPVEFVLVPTCPVCALIRHNAQAGGVKLRVRRDSVTGSAIE